MNQFPYKSFSWTIFDFGKFVKKLDKSAFLHHGTGIPRDIVKFWGIEHLLPNEKMYFKMHYCDNIFIMYITCDHINRYRLFWDKNFSKTIKDRYNEIFSLYKSESNVNNAPELVFNKLSELEYDIDFVEEVFYDQYNSKNLLFHEGKPIFYYSKKYERDSNIREIAIRIHGYDCHACGFNFEKKYGEIGKGFIEIHHINPLYINGMERIVDPKLDLLPVCSNCHRIIHRKRHFVYSIPEIRQLIRN